MEIVGSLILGALFGFLLSTGLMAGRVAKKEADQSIEDAKKEESRVVYENKELLRTAIRNHQASEAKLLVRS